MITTKERYDHCKNIFKDYMYKQTDGQTYTLYLETNYLHEVDKVEGFKNAANMYIEELKIRYHLGFI